MSTLQVPYNEFIEYPMGSGQLYSLPLDQDYVAPGTEYVVLQLCGTFGTRSAFLPTGIQLRCYSPGPDASNVWLDASEIAEILAVGNRIYAEVGNVDPVQVEAEAVTGERAEVVPTVYEIQTRRTLSVMKVIPQGPLINPIQPVSRATPIDDSCSCLFTNDPTCGVKLLFQLEKVV